MKKNVRKNEKRKTQKEIKEYIKLKIQDEMTEQFEAEEYAKVIEEQNQYCANCHNNYNCERCDDLKDLDDEYVDYTYDKDKDKDKDKDEDEDYEDDYYDCYDDDYYYYHEDKDDDDIAKEFYDDYDYYGDDYFLYYDKEGKFIGEYAVCIDKHDFIYTIEAFKATETVICICKTREEADYNKYELKSAISREERYQDEFEELSEQEERFLLEEKNFFRNCRK